MVSALLLVALGAGVFVGFNIGGSSTGVAWGPPVGAQLVNKTAAAALMTFFVFLGGWTVGREVVETMASLARTFTPEEIEPLAASHARHARWQA